MGNDTRSHPDTELEPGVPGLPFTPRSTKPPGAAHRLVGWVIDIVTGGVAGLYVGAVVAINLGQLFGVSYEETIPGGFRRSPVLGVVLSAALLAGPVAGVWAMRRFRAARRRANS